MAVLGLLYLAFLMLFLAHSILLHRYAEEAKGTPIPASRILLPSPTHGRRGAALAFIAAAVFLSLVLMDFMSQERSLQRTDFARSLPLATMFVVFPLAYYVVYVGRRLTRDVPGKMGQWIFVQKSPSRVEVTGPMLIAAIINFMGYLVNHFA